MLFDQDQGGNPVQHTTKNNFHCCNRLSGYRLRRGTLISSSDSVESVIGRILKVIDV